MESDDKNCDSLFTKTISKSNKPLIGLEYIIEFNDSQNVLRQFYCALCDMHCNEQELLFNLTTHEHRIKYLVSILKSFCGFFSEFFYDLMALWAFDGTSQSHQHNILVTCYITQETVMLRDA